MTPSKRAWDTPVRMFFLEPRITFNEGEPKTPAINIAGASLESHTRETKPPGAVGRWEGLEKLGDKLGDG